MKIKGKFVTNGDKVKLYYISDCNKNNNKVGIVISNSLYNYYPTGKIDSLVIKQSCTILYDDGNTQTVLDVGYEGSGLISPLEIIQTNRDILIK